MHVPRGRKRAASTTPKDRSLRKRSSRPTGPSAVREVAGAIRHLTDAFANESSFSARASQTLPPSTPVRLSTAVRKAAADERFTKAQRAQLIKLFSENISIADTYTACPDEEICTYLVMQALGLSSLPPESSSSSSQ